METRFTIALWARANAPAADYPTIASNKDWYSGEIRDYTERSNYGFSRTSGQLPGWAIALQPNGAWAWNLGDGKHRRRHDVKSVKILKKAQDQQSSPLGEIAMDFSRSETHEVIFRAV